MDNKDDKSSDVKATTKRDKWMPLIVLALFLLLVSEFFGTSCFFSSVFGIPCAGCGSTRAVRLLLQGKVADALRMHPLIFLTLFLLVVIPAFAVARFIAKKRGKPFRSPLSRRATEIIFFSLAALYLVVYIIRMILLFPHTEPMLYNKSSVWGKLISLIRGVFFR
ncbi:MAG TPA: DUF2752 domain-containing protein [Clostridiaceae bacterium]|jgi:hypothetical protein|nr:DUF2752 domain-containing protein [Clostridiaceae bacterium]